MSTDQTFLTQLFKQITVAFDLEEVRSLCFELNVEFDSLRGEGKEGKVRELVQFMARQNRLPDLLGTAREDRPESGWPIMPTGFHYEPEQMSEQRPNKPTKPALTFNLGDIQASIVNVGGEQTISGPVSVDMRQTDEAKSQGTHRAKTNQIEEIKQMLSQGSNGVNAPLFHLIDDILFELENLPDEANRQRVLNRLEALLTELHEETPDQDMLALTTQSLKRATDKLKADQPELITLVDQLAKLTLKTPKSTGNP